MRKAPLVLVVIPLLLSASVLEAKNRDRSWEFSGMAAHIDGDRTGLVDNTIGADLRIGYNITARTEVELNLGLASGDVANRDASFTRATVHITGNFLTDRETPWVPYITAGLGIITQTLDETDTELEAFDAGTILTLGVGTRYFWSDNWAGRVEARYNHHDAFEENQDEYVLALGVSWLLGGAK
jgi:opacity protein-like surface antigen